MTGRRFGMPFILSSTLIVGCSLQGFEQTSRYAETKFTLDSANFETETVHAVGEASCFYILFSIPVCKNQNIATVARQEITRRPAYVPLRHYHRKLGAGFVTLPQMTGRRFGMPFILSTPTLSSQLLLA
jgi:hypothetical protein